jgi:hypothetical protein
MPLPALSKETTPARPRRVQADRAESPLARKAVAGSCHGLRAPKAEVVDGP